MRDLVSPASTQEMHGEGEERLILRSGARPWRGWGAGLGGPEEMESL